MDKIEKLREFLINNDYKGWQTFDCRNLVDDPMATVYEEGGITVDKCNFYGYLEIFGLTDEEYRGLSDILNIC